MTTLFEGREVDGVTVKIGSAEVVTYDTYHHGAEVYVLVRATVRDIQHPDKDGMLFRTHIAKPDDAWIVPQLTAARMIDAVEPPKLPGTKREDEASSWEASVADFVEAAVAEGVTVTKATVAKPKVDESQRPHMVPVAAAPPDEEEAPADAPPPAGAPPEPEPAVAMATPEQRVSLSKHIHNLDESCTNDFVKWCSSKKVPLSPEHMTHDQAVATLKYLGEG